MIDFSMLGKFVVEQPAMDLLKIPGLWIKTPKTKSIWQTREAIAV